MTRVLFVSLLCLLVTVSAFAQTPPTPTSLTAVQVNESGHASVKLAWHGPRGAWSFRVSRSATDTSHYQTVGTTGDTVFFDNMVVPGTAYNYYVKAVAGDLQSGRSNVVNILVTTPPPPPPPPTPTNLVATLLQGGPNMHGVAVRLNWNGARGPWAFRISRSADDTSHYNTAGNTPDTTFVDFEVHPGTLYYYYVKSFGMNGGESGRSNVVNILVTAPPRHQGTIRGTVIDDSTNAPIRRVNIQFFRVAGPSWNCPPPVLTDSLGRYTALLDTGRYIIRANPMCERSTTCYRPEYYNNCPEPSCAAVVVLAESSTFVANFGLSRLTPPSYAYVSGSVKDTGNHPLRNVRVSLIRTVQEMNYLASLGFTPGTGDEEFELDGLGHTRGVIWTGWTDSLGNYRARVISNRNYLALASKEGYLPQYYNHKATVETADTIRVSRDTSGFNFNLAVRPVPNNSVSGRVADSANVGVPSRIVLIPVRVVPPTPWGVRYGHTDSLGNYTLTGVEAGRYFVMAMPFSNFAAAFYKANACGIIRIQDADTVNITGNVTGINICVRGVHHNGLAAVRGTIQSTNNALLAGVRVAAVDDQGEVIGIGITDAAGAYQLDAVAAGTVTVIADQYGFSSNLAMVNISQNTFTLDNVNITLTPNSVTSVGDPGVPEKFALDQNYPNPFNPSTKISYALSAPSVVTLKVFNILGQEVATLFDGTSAAGTFDVVWNGKDNLGRSAATGVYMYKLHATAGATEFTQVKKMLLLK